MKHLKKYATKSLCYTAETNIIILWIDYTSIKNIFVSSLLSHFFPPELSILGLEVRLSIISYNVLAFLVKSRDPYETTQVPCCVGDYSAWPCSSQLTLLPRASACPRTRRGEMELQFRKGNESMRISISGGTTKYFLGRWAKPRITKPGSYNMQMSGLRHSPWLARGALMSQ